MGASPQHHGPLSLLLPAAVTTTRSIVAPLLPLVSLKRNVARYQYDPASKEPENLALAETSSMTIEAGALGAGDPATGLGVGAVGASPQLARRTSDAMKPARLTTRRLTCCSPILNSFTQGAF
jgi:hypothetical protein